MQKNVFMLLFTLMVLFLPLSALADKLPGPFPWGMEKGDVLSDMQAADFPVDDAGDKVTIDLGHAYSVRLEAEFYFEANVLSKCVYVFKPAENKATIAGSSFQDLLEDLAIKYGMPEFEWQAGPPRSEEWTWAGTEDDVVLMVYGKTNEIVLMTLAYAAPVADALMSDKELF